MVRQLEETFGHPLKVLLTDSAYAGGADLAAAAAAGVAVYAPPPADGVQQAKQIPKLEFTWLPAERAYRCPQGHRLGYAGWARRPRSGTEVVRFEQYRCPPEHCQQCPLRQRSGQRLQHLEALSGLFKEALQCAALGVHQRKTDGRRDIPVRMMNARDILPPEEGGNPAT
jgi:hypothetical protein